MAGPHPPLADSPSPNREIAGKQPAPTAGPCVPPVARPRFGSKSAMLEKVRDSRLCEIVKVTTIPSFTFPNGHASFFNAC